MAEDRSEIKPPNVHICRPPTMYVRGVRICPDCGKHGRWAGFDQVWYGVTSTCLNCGRTWSDGEWMPLPFERQARQKAIKRAREMWSKAVRLGSDEYKAWLNAQLEEAA